MGSELIDGLGNVYQNRHRHPELSFQEHRSAGIVAGWLEDLGLMAAGRP